MPARFYVDRCLKLRNWLANIELLDFYGQLASAEVLVDLAEVVALFLAVDVETVHSSSLYLLNTQLTAQSLWDYAWRLCGNRDRLRSKQVVLPWQHQLHDEKMPIQVMDCLGQESHSDRYSFRIRVLCGSACSMSLSVSWSMPMCRLLARRAGYTSNRHSRPFRNHTELVNMRFLALASATKSKERPIFTEYTVPPGFKKRNVSIIELRCRRIDGRPWQCPERFDHACFECAAGYDRCPAAVRCKTIFETQTT